MKQAWIMLVPPLILSCGGGGGGGDDAAGDPDAPAEVEEDVPGDPVEDAVEDPADVEDDTPAGCPHPGDPGAGDHTVDIEHDSMARNYLLHVPESYDPATPTPLVVNMHGYTSNASQQVFFSNMNPTADEEGFIVLYPNGYESSWNGGACCGQAVAEGIDDVSFLVAVVEDVSSSLCIDPARVFAAGMSNGGYMTHRLACEAGHVFAAFAPVAAGIGITGCSPSRPVPILGFHGTDDSMVPFSTGEAAFTAWAGMDSCTGDPVRTTHADSYCDLHETCAGGAEVGFCTVTGMDHCWPGGEAARWVCETFIGSYSVDLNANEVMWDFFTRHPLP